MARGPSTGCSMTMFESLLIANRGEIARRIIRTARRMGLRTIAVYSDADAKAPFVTEADEAVRIGPAPARESYLRVDAIMEAAQRCGAQAIHPGYGFLSENSALPLACEAAGITFVGPTAAVMDSMGSKIGAKRLAVAADVPVIPGFDADDGSDATLLAAAAAVGYPLLVKASAGGGGKGMRAVSRPEELAEALAVARREAKTAFSDDRLLLERLVRKARHVEVQVVADHHGHVVHLFDRDCSMQRNNQKVLEEAPAPGLDPALRRRLLEDAVRLAASIGYRNLGTMEFLVDTARGEHFFLEMNTRLQVEHPVTEAITGLDLVELQLHIAAGEPLPFEQKDIVATGHAIEARLAAERPEAGFAPSAGRVALWAPPVGDGIRVDSGVETGTDVAVHYDSMIAKVIVHGPTRAAARLKLARALRRFTVLGLDTNRAFLADLCESGTFAGDGEATTDCLAGLLEGWRRPQSDPKRVAGLAAAAWVRGRCRVPGDAPENSPWTQLVGYRMLAGAGRRAVQEFVVEIAGQPYAVRLVVADAGIAVLDDAAECGIVFDGPPEAVRPFGVRYGEDTRLGIALLDGETVYIRYGDAEYGARVRPRLEAHENAATKVRTTDAVSAPMPGIIAEVLVTPGQQVNAGAPVVVLESMKLFQTLPAPRDGTVARVHVADGQSVSAGIELVSLEPETVAAVAANAG